MPETRRDTTKWLLALIGGFALGLVAAIEFLGSTASRDQKRAADLMEEVRVLRMEQRGAGCAGGAAPRGVE